MSVQIGGFQRRPAKNIKSRRALKKYEAKVVENPKTCLFLKGSKTSEVAMDALNNLANMMKPQIKKLAKRNGFHPFESPQHLEFLGYKNDASLFCFGSSSKKRPHNLVIGRQFDFSVLDMLELGVVAFDPMVMPETAVGETTCSIGSRPLFVFHGSEFDSDPFFIRLKNLLLDFFKGRDVSEVNLSGVDRVVYVALRSSDGESAVQTPSMAQNTYTGDAVICLRHFGVVRKGANAKAKLVDVGPNMDLEIRRFKFASDGDFKRACKVPREVLQFQKSMHGNITTDALGNIKGQLHVGKQSMEQLNLKRFKTDKVARRERADERRTERAEANDADAPETKRRRKRKSAPGANESLLQETDI